MRYTTKLISAVLIGGMALAQPAQAAKRAIPARAAAPAAISQPREPALPPPEAMIILIRSSIVALSQANMTGNYTVLSALGSPAFRAQNPPAQLAQAFAAFRTNHIDMNPVVFITPQLQEQPIVSKGHMRLVGYFPSNPMQVNFDLQFEPDQGSWKLANLGVNLSQIAQQSQAPAALQQNRGQVNGGR